MQDNSQEKIPADEPSRQAEKPRYDKNQKIAVIVLAVFALLISGMWVVQFKKSLTDSYAYKGPDTSKNSDPNAILRSKDTDQDGLNDWEELNQHGTSPYLDDSDSDGIKDGEEINKKTDPNCPEGTNCNQETTASTTVQNMPNLNTVTASSSAESLNLSISNLEDSQMEQLLSGKMDATSLRKMLLAAGMDEKMLNQISDEELMENYKGTFNQQKQ